MDVSLDKPARLLVGDLLLDPGRRRVSRGDDVLDLPKLSFQLFLALVEAAPNVLSAEELTERVWPGRIVSPETVTQRIKLVRQALGDDANAPRYIGLVRGEGYRLLVDIEALPPEHSGLARNLVAELGRRRVLLVALIYAAIAWSIMEVLSFLLDALPVFPGWSKTLVAIVFIVGFPLTMFLAWRFDIGPRGIRRTQAASTEGRVTIAAAMLLLIGATAGLFSLIYPRVLEQAQLDGQVAAPNSIAVLPFANDSGNPDDLYLSDGLGDELRDQLGSVAGLRVAARSSSVIFRDQPVDAQEIASRLGVEKLIEGAVSRQRNQLIIRIHIIDGASGFQTWSQSFVRASTDMLAIQQEIARAVVTQLLPERGDPQFKPPATQVASANELMWTAGYYYHQVREQPIVDLEALLKSIDLYRRATVADPNSALAHSRLGAALLYLGDVEAAEKPIFRALAINPDISEVQYTLGLYKWMRFLPGTGDAQRRALELNPNNPYALEAYGKWIWHQMITDEAEPFFRRALEIDPMSLSRYADLGNFYGMAGKRDKARAVAAEIPRRFSDSNAYMVVARVLELSGDIDEAIAWALRAHKLDPDKPEVGWMIAELYAQIGDFEAAHAFEDERAFSILYWERRYEEVIEFGEELVLEQPNQPQIWYALARAYAATGRYEQVIHVLRRQGLPERVYSENRRANAEEALVTLADALKEIGDIETAREYAEWFIPLLEQIRDTGAQDAWWPYLYSACMQSILDQDDAALTLLERIPGTAGLPWFPVLVDEPCFRKYSSEPRYLAVVQAIEGRKRLLRDRLPDTLARFQTVDLD